MITVAQKEKNFIGRGGFVKTIGTFQLFLSEASWTVTIVWVTRFFFCRQLCWPSFPLSWPLLALYLVLWKNISRDNDNGRAFVGAVRSVSATWPAFSDCPRGLRAPSCVFSWSRLVSYSRLQRKSCVCCSCSGSPCPLFPSTTKNITRAVHGRLRRFEIDTLACRRVSLVRKGFDFRQKARHYFRSWEALVPVPPSSQAPEHWLPSSDNKGRWMKDKSFYTSSTVETSCRSK